MTTQPQSNGEHGSSPELEPWELERGERLLYRLTEFSRLLWESGLNVGPHQVLELGETLNSIEITNKEDFYYALKCSLLTKHEQEPIFDQMFGYFWLVRSNMGNQKDKQANSGLKKEERQMRLPPSERKRMAEHLNAPDQRKDTRGQMRTLEQSKAVEDENKDDKNDPGDPRQTAYSAIEQLRKKDFENFSWEEVQEAKRLMAAMRWNLGQRATRRKSPSRKGSYPDMRRIVRRNLKYGAELLEVTWRETKHKPRPLVIICDISGSMSLYSRLLLHFIHTVSNGLMNVETFVFGTRLTRITRQLKKRDVDDAIRDVSKIVQDWSGGTRIGDALHYFNFTWAKRVLGRGAVVLLISDGWDRGDVTVLKDEMDRLQRSCHRLIWLNPLLGSPDYRPLTIGMKTALPFVDDFLPSHNLDSLIHLGNLLSSIDDSRPLRSNEARQRAVQAWSKPKM
ncbi:MAG: VWA domain-containing protein [Ktedonobacteraceae bacterium]